MTSSNTYFDKKVILITMAGQTLAFIITVILNGFWIIHQIDTVQEFKLREIHRDEKVVIYKKIAKLVGGMISRIDTDNSNDGNSTFNKMLSDYGELYYGNLYLVIDDDTDVENQSKYFKIACESYISQRSPNSKIAVKNSGLILIESFKRSINKIEQN